MSFVLPLIFSLFVLVSSFSSPATRLGLLQPSAFFQHGLPSQTDHTASTSDLNFLQLQNGIGTVLDWDKDDSGGSTSSKTVQSAAEPTDSDDGEVNIQGTFLDNPEIETAATSFRSVIGTPWSELPGLIETDKKRVVLELRGSVVLVTTYSTDKRNAGELWAVQTESSARPVQLLSGLDRPTGMCYDSFHALLYICDMSVNDHGRIYQFEIQLPGTVPVLNLEDGQVVYEGSPSDCVLDDSGNLYLTEYFQETVATIPYLDLWAGSRDHDKPLYTNSDRIPSFSKPVSIAVTTSNDLVVLNSVSSTVSGLVLTAPLVSTLGEISTYIQYPLSAVGLTVCGHTAFFISGGKINALELETGQIRVVVKTGEVSSAQDLACHGTDLYVTDDREGKVFHLDTVSHSALDTIAVVPHAQALLYVSASCALFLSLLVLLILC